jgi:hypothetical protein
VTCSRASHEVYLRFEEGAADEHAVTCPTCQEALQVARRFAEVMPEVGAEHKPAGDWQARFLAQIESRRASRREATLRRRWWVVALPAALAAAVIIYVIIPPRQPDPPSPGNVVVELSIQRGGEPQRTRTASVGDVVTVEARGERVELWIYRDGKELVLRCPGGAECSAREGGASALLRVDRRGVYQVLAIEAPGSSPAATIDESMNAVVMAGDRYTMIDFEVL